MNHVQLGQSDLRVTPICLGTMTFGEQVDEATSHAILGRALERGINFIDTAEMYSVPTRAETFGATETIIGNWFAATPGARHAATTRSGCAGGSWSWASSTTPIFISGLGIAGAANASAANVAAAAAQMTLPIPL